MPRQLPWLAKSSGTRTQVKTTTTSSKRPRADPESDDEFFRGTVLESKGKGKERADPFASDDDLPEVPKKKSFRSIHVEQRTERALSSSPPPAVEDVPRPTIELMRKGINRFDLRDDEWMMVEDEFLQTAHLFTRHLHLAEYERLKELVKSKKDIAQPVVASAKPSEELQTQMKAEKQMKAQKQALRDALGFSGKDDEAGSMGPPKRVITKSVTTSSSGSGRTETHTTKKAVTTQKVPTSDASDSEDLDAPPKPSHSQSAREPSSAVFAKPALPPARPTASASNTGSSYRRSPLTGKHSQMSSTRTRRPNLSFDDGYPSKPFDDGYPSSPLRPPSPTKTSRSSTTRILPPSRSPTRRSTTSLFDDDLLPPSRKPLSQGNADRLAKRKAEREKVKKEAEEKSIGLDDIPTFLF